MEEDMAITEIFDLAKKKHDGGDINNGYIVGGRPFDCYLTNEDWEGWKENLPDRIKKQFDDAKGGEMKEYTRKGVKFPPKMASYASSSRFMVYEGKEIEGFVYEKQLTTGLGGYPANLDGYLESNNVYVEAKCHEFYNYSKPKMGRGHKSLLDGITPLLKGRLKYSNRNGYLYLTWDDKDSGHFDLKQMLCHLSGIANYVLSPECKSSIVNFIYLVYDPSEVLRYVEKEQHRTRILELYNEEKKTAKRIDFKEIYGAILRYFNRKYKRSESEMEEMINNFSFQFCTQNTFKSVVEKAGNKE